MRTLKAIIVDDELAAIDVLTSLLSSADYDMEVKAAFNDPRQVSTGVISDADVLFIDVQMPFLNGFELLSKLGPLDVHIIFTTAHDTYALEALKVGACDYLLKPIDRDDLDKALQKVHRREAERKNVTSEQPQMRLGVPTSTGFQMLEVSTILRLQSDAGYTYVFCKGVDKPLLVSRTLKVFESHLTSNQFIRVNQSNIININAINSVDKRNGGIIHMKTGETIALSPTYRKAFYEVLSSSLI